MTKSTADTLVAWISALCRHENVGEYRAHFLGGEPFTSIDKVIYIIEQLEKALPPMVHGAKEGKYVIFTNGDYLSKKVLQRLKALHVKIMLNPTYDPIGVVEKKIKTIKGIMGGCSLAICLDYKNMKNLSSLVRLATRHNCHTRINRLYNGGSIPGYVDDYLLVMERALDIILKAKEPMWPNFIMESTYVTWDSPKNPNACGRWFLAFDANGNIRSCNADMDTTMGSIFTVEPRIGGLQFTHRWSAKNLPECQGCEFITHCQGGCPYTRKLAYGTYDKRSPFCKAFKQLFPKLYKIRDRWQEEHGLD